MEIGYELDRKPLDPEERERVISAAIESSTVAGVCTLLGLFTGIKRRPLCHVTGSMVRQTADGLQIELPPKSECICGGKGQQNNEWERNMDSCQFCDEGVYEFENPRRIPIRDERAVDAVSRWFDLYERLPSVATYSRKVKSVGEKAGVHRLTIQLLRHSFGVILAGREFEKSEIARVMGFGDTSEDYINRRCLAYGRVSGGPNYYRCSVEYEDGSRCQNGVSAIDEDVCGFRRNERCNDPNAQSGTCDRQATFEDGKCAWHTDEGCSATTNDGDPCQMAVGDPDAEFCHYHRSKVECNAPTPTAEGSKCSRKGTESDGRCHWHTET
jgi:hypothetical protein